MRAIINYGLFILYTIFEYQSYIFKDFLENSVIRHGMVIAFYTQERVTMVIKLKCRICAKLLVMEKCVMKSIFTLFFF